MIRTATIRRPPTPTQTPTVIFQLLPPFDPFGEIPPTVPRLELISVETAKVDERDIVSAVGLLLPIAVDAPSGPAVVEPSGAAVVGTSGAVVVGISGAAVLVVEPSGAAVVGSSGAAVVGSSGAAVV